MHAAVDISLAHFDTCLRKVLAKLFEQSMRLDDFDPNINVEDQRGSGGGGFGGGGGGIGGGLLFAFLPFIFNRFGCVGVLVVGTLTWGLTRLLRRP